MATIETLQKAQKLQRDAAELFVAYASGKDHDECMSKLKNLSNSKSELRQKVEDCAAVYTECSFELVFAVLSPRDLKPISGTGINNLLSNTVSLIGACESAYSLLGMETQVFPDESKNLGLEALRNRREGIGDEQLLKYLLKR
jgi:hypothetical protein